MANASALNFSLNTAGDTFSAIWKLSRALISAGWHYKASGNGQSSGVKDTSGNAALDQWGVDGAVNLTNASRGTGSGAGVSIGAASASTGLSVITGVSGFTSASVGDYLTVTGSGASNNGSFRITAQTGTTVTVYAPQYASETGNASLSVVEQFGGADGSIGSYSTTSTGHSTLINFTTSVFNGFTTTDVGRCITILNSGSGNNGTYLIAQWISSTNVLLYGPSITVSDAQNPTVQWVEYAPLNQIYPSYIQAANGSGAWLNLQGPTVMKIPIGANVPTGTFIRGENVTQSTTGAQGEILGLVTDTGGSTGYLVILPRVVGSGGQASSVATYGWNNTANTDTVTGALSGATVTTPVSTTPIAYISEVVFWKSNAAATGHVYSQRIDQNASTESATTATTGRFSTLAASGTVTSQLAPAGSAGGNPTTNGFPTTGTYVVIGTGGSGAGSTGPAQWSGAVNPTSPGRAQLIAANNIEQQGISVDGSWLYLQSCNGVGYQCLSYQRMDNNEDGDLDPFVHQAHLSGTLNGAPNRTVDATGVGSATDNMNTGATWINSATNHGFKGFRRRGLSSETFNYFSAAILADCNSSSFVITTNATNPDQVATAPATTYVREPLWLYLTPFTAQLATGRMRKGTPRWLQLAQGIAVNSTFDTLQWVVLSSTAAMFVAGPWDGATTPSF